MEPSGTSPRPPTKPKKRAAKATAAAKIASPETPEELAFAQARREKIARLKKSIADGTYQISSEDVARKVIEHMLGPKG